ncbi:hypothetical protein lerEdw1_007697 [Lerista edwardsae]|nr:hypothetical protein lerEdw1_007703 [Lerista edwardsae]KAJ6650455.1 hypothetical protein lerEdw1_007697 [Lerista edwardsae]
MQNQGNCYSYFKDKKTWFEAEVECQSYGRGAHLASVLSKAESFLVGQHISRQPGQAGNVWIGLNDIFETGTWRWADESVFNYAAWRKGEPNNQWNEYCVELADSSSKQTILWSWVLKS